MRRLALLAGAILLLAGCGSHGQRLGLEQAHGLTFGACASTDCGPYSETLRWGSLGFPSTTGYYVFENGTQVASVTASPYTFYGLDCGTTFTLGVEAHDGSGNHSAVYSTSYTTAACPGASGPTEQALISQGEPAYSTGTTQNAASNMVDSSYDYFSCTPTCAGIVDLSGTPSGQRGNSIVSWWDATIDFDTTDDGPDGSPVNQPTGFTIDCNTAAGGGSPPTTGWTTLQTVTSNKFNAGQYELNLASCNWLRMNVTASTGGNAAWHLDVSSCSSSCAAADDAWLFLGDSITSISLTAQPTSPPNFNQTVNAGDPSFYPSGIDGGNSGWTTGNFLATDASTSKAFVNEYMDDFPAARYVTLNLGTNDIDQSVSTSTFLSNMETLVDDVEAKGRVPVVPTIPWAPSACGYSALGTGDNPANSGTANYDIEHDVWTMPGVVAGPDLWTFFDQNQSLIGLGNCPHPSQPTGTDALRTEWADWALASIY